MKFVKPALPLTDFTVDMGLGMIADAWTEDHVKEYAEAYLKAYLESREPVAWAYRAFPDSELITLTMDKDDLAAAVDGTIELYED